MCFGTEFGQEPCWPHDENDLATISGLLISTNGHLSSACHKTENANTVVPLGGPKTACP